MELYPNEKVQLGIGPTIENGFYYDIDMTKKLADEDLKTIEDKMKEIIKRGSPVGRGYMQSEAQQFPRQSFPTPPGNATCGRGIAEAAACGKWTRRQSGPPCPGTG